MRQRTRENSEAKRLKLKPGEPCWFLESTFNSQAQQVFCLECKCQKKMIAKPRAQEMAGMKICSSNLPVYYQPGALLTR